MGIWNPDIYIKAWHFASHAHQGQQMPGSELPYINHIGNVAMEAMATIAQSDEIEQPDLLVQCALLHDVIEDTDCRFADVEAEFGLVVANGVLALSKDESLPTKRDQMVDSLNRIKAQPPEVWMVKMADRITNLQSPPHYWNREKIKAYQDEARLILAELGAANAYLAGRLEQKIENYTQYL